MTDKDIPGNGRSSLGTKCGHNEYWKTHYGNCMACQRDEASRERDKYCAALEAIGKTHVRLGADEVVVKRFDLRHAAQCIEELGRVPGSYKLPELVAELRAAANGKAGE